MDRSDRLARIDDMIHAQGIHTQGVLATYPGEAAFCYTVGNHRYHLPELIVFGAELGAAAGILRDVAMLIRRGEVSSDAGTRIEGGAIGYPSPLAVRLGDVGPVWARRYGRVAFGYYGLDDPGAIPFRQVLLSDVYGRFWDEDGGHDPGMEQVQPDLSRERFAWRRPFVPFKDFVDPPECDVYALVPIIEGGEDCGRWEAVPANLVDDRIVRVERPPVMADWVTTGALLHVGSVSVGILPHLPAGRAYVRLERESPQVHSVWRLHAHDKDEYPDLIDRLRVELDLPGVTSMTTHETIHVASPPREVPKVRSRMRRLVRDGLAEEWDPYHHGALRCHPDCWEHASQRI